jgi:hypothetical protein
MFTLWLTRKDKGMNVPVYGIVGAEGLFPRIRGTDLFPYFVGTDSWKRGHFLQLVLRLIHR